MKKFAFVGLALFVALQTASALTFDDIKLWAGSGSNQAALVIDWNDGKNPESIVWGYRWDGTATGKDMLDAVLAADARLFAATEFWPSFNGYTIYGLGYDVDGDGGGFAVGERENGPTGFPGRENGHALDTDDHYEEGWFTGYWSYYVQEGTTSFPGSWNYSGWGLSARTLSNGSWDGWSFSDFAAGTGGVPDLATPATPVPEPASLVVLALGAGLAARRRARKGS